MKPTRPDDPAFTAWLLRLGQNVRDRRRAAGLRLVDLAERSGLSKSTVGEVELGDVVPSLASLAALAGALDVRVSEILPNVP